MLWKYCWCFSSLSRGRNGTSVILCGLSCCRDNSKNRELLFFLIKIVI
ncbi:hypothetical protein DsansV1_C01g0003821 [Dioscorea sansibarensis]